MNSKEKSKYRSSSKWKNWRKYIIHKRDYTCEISGFRRKKGLQVHHFDDSNYKDLKENKFAILTAAEHKLIERLLSRKSIDIDLYCENLKKVFLNSMKYRKKNNVDDDAINEGV